MTFDEKLNEITKLIQDIHKKGWSPGTSTNYSFKDNNEIYVSKSGIDKSKFSKYDFINIDIFICHFINDFICFFNYYFLCLYRF